MGIISQKEVKEYSLFFKLTIVLSLITVTAAVIIYISMPKIKEYAEKKRIDRDIKSIERVYSAMQSIVEDESLSNMPTALWDISLSDFSEMSTLQEFNEELCKRLDVSSLEELEGEGFKSEAFKGSRYVIYMYEDSKEIHLTVRSTAPNEHGDVMF
ncbi:MAG: hypothetical protein IKP31_02885 [Lachnospiraceae bacterium]|nr:hypothetical protein [Lachnospiraceae bacterium]